MPTRGTAPHTPQEGKGGARQEREGARRRVAEARTYTCAIVAHDDVLVLCFSRSGSTTRTARERHTGCPHAAHPHWARRPRDHECLWRILGPGPTQVVPAADTGPAAEQLRPGALCGNAKGRGGVGYSGYLRVPVAFLLRVRVVWAVSVVRRAVRGSASTTALVCRRGKAHQPNGAAGLEFIQRNYCYSDLLLCVAAGSWADVARSSGVNQLPVAR